MLRLAILPDICPRLADLSAERLHIVADKMKKDQWITRTWHTLCGRHLQTGEVVDANLPLCRDCWKAAVPSPKKLAPKQNAPKPTVPRFVLPAPIKQPKSLQGQRTFGGSVWDGEKWVAPKSDAPS